MTREELLEAFSRRVKHPVSSRELVQLLKIPRESRVTVRRLLRALVSDGELIQVRGQRLALPGTSNLLIGRLTAHPDGYGFVTPERREAAGDVYVSGSQLKDALHGDRVAVRLEPGRSESRRQGRVIKILDRGSAEVVGRFRPDGGESGYGHVTALDRRVALHLQVAPGETMDAASGEIVIAEITRWPTATRGPAGRVIEVMGAIDGPGVDTRIIIRKHGLPDAHSDAAIAEATRAGDAVDARDLEGRSDFRQWATVTIDGEHARDFDDAISVDRLENGHYWLAVHIADVAHYVVAGSVLDADAADRSTSVYFPDRAIHMFPAELATGLCSLKPSVDRLVQSCLMEIDEAGDVVRHEFHDGVIRSAARMTYTEVNAIVTHRDPETMGRYEPLVPLFDRMRALCDVLSRARRRRGSIDFDIPEAELVLDDAGRVEAVVASQRNVAHRLIEEFMLLANQTVARYLEGRAVPALFRVHDAPDPARVEEFESFAAGLGYSLAAPPSGPEPRHFQGLIDRLQGKPEQKAIAYLMLRTMAIARYDAVNTGHFGLAAESYTHFTSPIRRYPDLVVHRLLREARRGPLPDARVAELNETLPELGRHTSARERRAMEAERELLRWKKIRFMADKVGEEFDGFVMGVTPFGLFVELAEHFVEGLVHVSAMADDDYRYQEGLHALRGERSGRVFRLGDRLRVQIARVDLDERRIDLAPVGVTGTAGVHRRPRPKAPRSTARRPPAKARPSRAFRGRRGSGRRSR